MTITRDQFIRGFNALKAAQTRRERINMILNEGGDGHQDIGLDPAARELEQQLVERCRDHEDENGPWPENSGVEGAISLGLYPAGMMTIEDAAGNKLPHLTTAEDIWAMWEETKTGPFRPLPLTRYDISVDKYDCLEREEWPTGEWVRFDDVQALLSGARSMTFRVIEGGGRPVLPAAGTVEEARAEIIDRVAAAIWSRQDEHPDPAYATWDEMKKLAADDPSRAGLVRVTLAQARAAIGALKSVEPYDPEYMLFCRGMGLSPEEFADASQALDLFVDEVLK